MPQKSSENTTSGLQRGIQISMPGNVPLGRSVTDTSSFSGGKVGGPVINNFSGGNLTVNTGK